jgi:hypothetical protein
MQSALDDGHEMKGVDKNAGTATPPRHALIHMDQDNQQEIVSLM